jgi:hypothetical protein
MKKLTRNQWIMIGVGVVVLFVVYNYIKNRGFYLEFEKPEEKSSAGGGLCICSDGHHVGNNVPSSVCNWVCNRRKKKQIRDATGG